MNKPSLRITLIGAVMLVCNLIADVSRYAERTGDTGWNAVGTVGLVLLICAAVLALGSS